MKISKEEYEVNKYLLLKRKTKCSICGEDDKCCLEFHHILPKSFRISYAVKNVKPDKFKQELDKCICVCSNCHKKIHNKKGEPSN